MQRKVPPPVQTVDLATTTTDSHGWITAPEPDRHLHDPEPAEAAGAGADSLLPEPEPEPELALLPELLEWEPEQRVSQSPVTWAQDLEKTGVLPSLDASSRRSLTHARLSLSRQKAVEAHESLPHDRPGTPCHGRALPGRSWHACAAHGTRRQADRWRIVVRRLTACAGSKHTGELVAAIIRSIYQSGGESVEWAHAAHKTRRTWEGLSPDMDALSALLLRNRQKGRALVLDAGVDPHPRHNSKHVT